MVLFASAGIRTNNQGGFACDFRVKSNNGQTGWSGEKSLGGWAEWSYDDLIGAGFKDGDSCWVAVKIQSGQENHESGNNFKLSNNGIHCSYDVTGTTVNPSWDGPNGYPDPTVVRISNHGLMTAQFRVRGGGHETGLSSDFTAGRDCNYKWSELVDAGFKTGDDCWVSVDCKGGKTNHESGDNFRFYTERAAYTLTGGIWDPSFSLHKPEDL